jgi:hypothetical protein
MLSHLRFELGGFFRSHWPHFLLAVPGALLCTILHEGAHALAVILQGGQVTKFVWLPSIERWGYIQYQFPDQYHYSTFVIAVAPYCLWLLLILLAGVLSLKTNPFMPWVSSTIFIWMFVVPLGDIANAAIPYLLGSLNDFRDAFGFPTGLQWALIVLFGIASAVFGMVMQRRLYRERALSVIGYTLMALAGLALIGVLHIAKVHLT